MTIGSLGNVVFEASADAVRTFSGMKFTKKPKYSTHALHMKKSILELTGFEPDEASFDMTLSAFLGINPEESIRQLEDMMTSGRVCNLILGNTVYGNSWVITSLSETFAHVFNDGLLISCEVSVSIKEYS